MKKKVIKKPIIFIQDTGIYTIDIIVSVGANKKQFNSFVKKNVTIIGAQKEILADDGIWEFFNGKLGTTTCYKDGGITLLMFPYEDTWKFWEVLIHELNHIIDYIAESRNLSRDIESRAYLIEYLFHSIRRKLQGLDKLK